MIHKKFHFPILLLIAVFLVLQSCKKNINTSAQKNTPAEIDRLIDLSDHSFEKVPYDSAYFYHNKAKSLFNSFLNVDLT